MSVAAIETGEVISEKRFLLWQQIAETEIADTSVETVDDQEYAHSTETIRGLGEAAVRGLAGYERHHELAYDDFRTAVVEMINSDEDFGEYLDVENSGVHTVANGRARSHTGDPMVEVVARGAAASRQLAQSDKVYEGQALRDECDFEIAERADELKVGETLWGISMAPRKDLRLHPKIYKQLGYADLLYAQAYVRVDEDTLRTFSFSADASDPDAWRAVLARHGMVIPEEESDNTWLRHAQVMHADETEVPSFLHDLRRDYYRSIGREGVGLSATEYAVRQDKLLRTIFDTYYVAMAEANYLGDNNQTMRDFAGALLTRDIKALEPSIRRQLIRIRNAQKFDDESTKTMDKLIRYAAAEQLRKGLSNFVRLRHHSPQRTREEYVPRSVAPVVIDPFQLHQMLAMNVQAGAIAGREYLGCAGNVSLTESSNNSKGESADRNPQAAYGGRTGEEAEIGGKKLMSCPHCQALVYDDPCAVRLKCWDCGALVVNGKIKSTGDGGSKVREAKREAERAEKARAEAAKSQEKEPAGERSDKARVQHVAQLALAA